jgi:hypothetical protein
MSQWTVVAVRCDRKIASEPDGQCAEQHAARPGERLPELLARLAVEEGWSREPGSTRDHCAVHSLAVVRPLRSVPR